MNHSKYFFNRGLNYSIHKVTNHVERIDAPEWPTEFVVPYEDYEEDDN